MLTLLLLTTSNIYSVICSRLYSPTVIFSNIDHFYVQIWFQKYLFAFLKIHIANLATVDHFKYLQCQKLYVVVVDALV